ncbi:MAG: translation elongation factor Ts [Candidatus Tectomicrobia bacterium]|nr:translation elongation factor Ts [Candidatus Tectomicrobia bacterium]
MAITSAMVKELRERSGAGIMDCKSALQVTDGNLDAAIDHLRKKGLAAAAKKAGRATSEGLVISYIHPGNKIGVLLEVNCETDFVARTEEFQNLARDLAMHVAALAPQYARREDVPEAVLRREQEIYASQAQATGKPPQVVERIVQGKLDKWYGEVCLLDQPFVKEDKKTVSELVKELIAKLGENIVVRRFSRFQLGA